MKRLVVLSLTLLQARGLMTLAGEGAEGLLNDPAAAKAYVGNSRAQRAARESIELLNAAIHKSSSADATAKEQP